MSKLANAYSAHPDARGRFGDYGGRFVAETLMPLVLAVEKAYAEAKEDSAFVAQMDDLWTHYVGRPSPLYFAERLTATSAAPRSTSSATSSTTRARTRSTTASARCSLH